MKKCCCSHSAEQIEETRENAEACCAARKKVRDPEEYRKLTNRLNRVEGQLHGIRKMLEDDAYCPDILTQTSAAIGALNAFSRELLSEHIHSCVKRDIMNGRDEVIDELMDTLRKMMR